MRITSIHIEKWKHFENIRMDIGADTALVCLVGANGTGKSYTLELVGACANHLGLSRGIENPRGDPFADQHKFSLVMQVADGASEAIDPGLNGNTHYTAWDRTLTITSEKSEEQNQTIIHAGGITDHQKSREFAKVVVDALRNSQNVHFVSLDSNRAYPKKTLPIHELAQAYETPWETPEWTKGRSFRATSHLYDEWIKYLLAQENNAGAHLLQGMRRAQEAKKRAPRFKDHIKNYKTAVREVLPYLVFVGVDAGARALLFDSTGTELAFDSLSGGEREIAFLIGQIDRFQLRRGLFLLDEPELHLNADLMRTWISYLSGTVETGQVWLATHSLEAVEAAGQEATFLFEKNAMTKQVDTVARLDDRPVLSALSRAVGTPAFSLHQLRFVFVEGEDSVGERERFRKLTASESDTRFLPSGPCQEVMRRLSAMKSLSAEANEAIRIGGIIDRDFRQTPEVQKIRQTYGVFVLPVLEVENFFLHPATLDHLISQNGVPNLSASEAILSHADKRAGAWIMQDALAAPIARSLPELSPVAKDASKSLRWSDFVTDSDEKIQKICQSSGLGEEDREKLEKILQISKSAYKKKRTQADFWTRCEGKEMLNPIATQIGFANAPSLVQAAYAVWAKHPNLLSAELNSLRKYIQSL